MSWESCDRCKQDERCFARGECLRAGNKSEVARLLGQIREEYEAALSGLSGLAQGTSRHSFITARMENMGKLQEGIEALMEGDRAGSMALVIGEMVSVEQGRASI